MVPTMPTRELYVQGTQEPQPPGIEPPHWTTEDYRSRYWAVYVSYQFLLCHLTGGVPKGGGGVVLAAVVRLACLCLCVCVC